ncbi:MAG: hypothetical protein QOG29_1140 [Gaiellaceae bacterium]|jgi:hypothetical protein|nr:hypothetical protein [Gaiellaceae bacterium]MDX6478553.1 hypothetical protein [Gaiellaceae bacterium]MDX6482571.1 hypothetical protein [Gaiellaceae bacterium]
MVVELDVFSGRPNPRWELDEPTANPLRRLLSQLTVAGVTPPEPPGLGYRGFVVADDGRELRAYNGYVTGSDVVLADPARAVERFLLAQLPPEHEWLRGSVALGADA